MRGNATKMGRKKDRIAAQTWQLSSEPGKSLFFIYILIFGILILAECPFPMLCVCVCVLAISLNTRRTPLRPAQASVMIAASSPHRKAALEAVHWAIDTLKKRLAIWKKEHYQDGSVWKANKEFNPKALVAEARAEESSTRDTCSAAGPAALEPGRAETADT